MKTNKIAYWVYWTSTALFSLMMLIGAGSYFFNYEHVGEEFASLGYPLHIIYPLAIAKLLGIIAILSKKSNTLKEWAYAGFFFDIALAIMAHIHAGDDDIPGALMALTLLMVSYFSDKKVFQS